MIVRQVAENKNTFLFTSNETDVPCNHHPAKVKYLGEKLQSHAFIIWRNVCCLPNAKYDPNINLPPFLQENPQIFKNNSGELKINCSGDYLNYIKEKKNVLKSFLAQSDDKENNLYLIESAEKEEKIEKFNEILPTFKNQSALPEIVSNFTEYVSSDGTFYQEAKKKNKKNQLLKNFDSFLANLTLDEPKVEEISQKLAVRVENLSLTKTIGLRLIDKRDRDEFKSLSANDSADDFAVQADLIAGIELPRILVDAGERLAVSVIKDSKSLFSAAYATSAVISVTLDGGHRRNLSEPIILLFPKKLNNNSAACVYWDFTMDMEEGNWSTEGCTLNKTITLEDTLIDECHCWHLTHFALIFWDSKSTAQFKNTFLDQVSSVGCITSLVCLAGVFLAAIISPKWRKGAGQKLLLQMALSLALLLSLFLVTANVDLNKWGCFFAGFFMHYAILAHVFWMLIAAYLQYIRLVKVIAQRKPNLILKSAVVGWIFPIIPGMVVLLSQKFDFYSEIPLCLPTGLAFYLSILLPVTLIQLINLAVFALITFNICRVSSFRGRKHDANRFQFRRFIQLVFLFTLLGLNWIFAIFQVAFPDARFAFGLLFTIFGTFQGMVYFCFFVLMHKDFPSAWRRFVALLRNMSETSEEKSLRHSENTLMTTISRIFTSSNQTYNGGENLEKDTTF
ncbi:adhesion G-protein coupled receptor G2-like [Neocloeon triangulifer]|uniref:adhesion G-protein coupled receptor G2-like n=1 Tax=Neocloeon triangulifer TaxID=2078957 RepID=UPI00286F4215|nr:adhesion G-protein coupled receptor G2-like [Neocloeon triangulifer]